ncbi:MAG TPA: N,N-dimethylformamidase beta subunit family domain-containing protein [Solirubrobacterales bacterium]|nr:N,N-dimethylformamidase beta subunit family domain-containing protein [Solirubrobacterales bacterium]
MDSPANMLRVAVEGYASAHSYEPGDTLSVHCSSEVPRFDVEIVRCGREREVVWGGNGITGEEHALPDDPGQHGCGWPVSFEVEIPEEWRPGYYEVVFSWEGKDPDELSLPAFFFLRAPRASASRPSILLVASTATYMAYNDWNHSKSLYTGGVRVSSQRPLPPGFLTRPPGVELQVAAPVGEYDPEYELKRSAFEEHRLSGWCLGAGFFQWERPFAEWCEEEGIELDYAVSTDLEFRPEVLEDRSLVVSVGHDEYWSWGMRDNMEAYIAAGGNAMFLSGNAVYWQVRFEDEGRTMVSYKYAAPRLDPEAGTERQTGIWSDFAVGRPENELTGVSFTHGGYVRAGYGVPHGSGGYTVWRPEHWIFEGTDLRYGDLLGNEHGVVGFEADGCELGFGEDGLPYATNRDGTPEGFEVLGTSPARLWTLDDLPPTAPPVEGGYGDMEYTQWRVFDVDPGNTPQSELEPRVRHIAHGNAVMGMYTKGGTVFTSGCTDWTCGIEGRDPVIVQITRNLIRRLGGA